jgi:hypothetical protein
LPGWNSTTGNIFAAHVIEGDVKNDAYSSPGARHQVCYLAEWYEDGQDDSTIGFFRWRRHC